MARVAPSADAMGRYRALVSGCHRGWSARDAATCRRRSFRIDLPTRVDARRAVIFRQRSGWMVETVSGRPLIAYGDRRRERHRVRPAPMDIGDSMLGLRWQPAHGGLLYTIRPVVPGYAQ